MQNQNRVTKTSATAEGAQKKTRIEAMAKILGCSVSQINEQLCKNARQLRAMEQQARRSGKKLNGFTADDLDAMARSYEERAVKCAS